MVPFLGKLAIAQVPDAHQKYKEDYIGLAYQKALLEIKVVLAEAINYNIMFSATS